MSRFRVTAPDGRTVTIEGATPPTEADLDEIFAGLPPRRVAPRAVAQPSFAEGFMAPFKTWTDRLKVPGEILGTPFRGLGMLADVGLHGGIEGSRVRLGEDGQVQAPAIPQMVTESIRRRAASLNPSIEPPGSVGEAANRALTQVTGLKFGDQAVPGDEPHIRQAFEQEHPALAVGEAVAEPVAELASAVMLDPALAGFLKAGNLVAAGQRAEAALAQGARLAPKTVAMFERIALQGRVASLGQKGIGASLAPGMAISGGEQIGEALSSPEPATTPGNVRKLVGAAGDIGLAALTGRSLYERLPGRPVREAAPQDVVSALEAAAGHPAAPAAVPELALRRPEQLAALRQREADVLGTLGERQRAPEAPAAPVPAERPTRSEAAASGPIQTEGNLPGEMFGAEAERARSTGPPPAEPQQTGMFERRGEVGAVLLRSKPSVRVKIAQSGEEGRAIGFTPDGTKIVVDVGRSRREVDPRGLEYLGIDQPSLYGRSPAQRMAAADAKLRPSPVPVATPELAGRIQEAAQGEGGRTTGKPPAERFNVDRMGMSDEAKAEFLRQMDALEPELEQAQGKRSFAQEKADTLRLLGIITPQELEFAARHGLLGTSKGHLAVRYTLDTFRSEMRTARENVTTAQRDGRGVKEAQDTAVAAAMKFGNFVLAAKGARADAARALGGYRIFSEPLSTGEKALNEAIRRKTLTPEQMAEILLTAEQAPQNLGPVLARILRAGYGAKGRELYKAGLLSAPPTHAANFIGNTVKSVMTLGEAAFTSWITEPLAANAQGRARERVHGEASAMVRAASHETPAALRQFVTDVTQALTLGPERLDFESGRKIEHQIGAIEGAKGRAVRIPFRLLEAADDFFKRVARAQETARQQKRGGPVDPVKVEQAAREATFQETPGDFAQAVMGLKAKHGAVDVAIPFTRTPANIFSQTIARTPFGMRQVWKAYQAFREGKISGGEFSDAITKPVLGTIIGGAFLLLAKQGLITGTGPTDKKKASALRETGWQPLSGVVPWFDGRKQYISYARFEPISSIVGMAGDLAEGGKPALTEDYMEKVGTSVAVNLTSKTWLINLREIIEFLTDLSGEGGDFAQRLAGSAVPAIVSRTARAVDPVIRERSSIGQEIQSRIPGLSQRLPPRYTPTGREMTRGGTAIERFASPADRSAERTDTTLEKTLVRIGFAPSLPSKQGRVPLPGGKGEKVDWSPEQYRQLVAGNREASDFIRKNYLGKPTFESLADTEDEGGQRSKEYLIRQVYDRFREQRRETLTNEVAKARRRLAAVSALEKVDD